MDRFELWIRQYLLSFEDLVWNCNIFNERIYLDHWLEFQRNESDIVDDVLSSGMTMSKTIGLMKDAGADVKLCLVLVNKTAKNEIDDVPLRGVIRAVNV